MPPTPSGQHLTVFNVMLSTRRNSFPWLVDIDDTSLSDLLTAIRAKYQSPALENDNTLLKFLTPTGAEYSAESDDAFRMLLRFLVSKNTPQFTVTIEAHPPCKAMKDLKRKYDLTSYNMSAFSQFSPGKFLSHIPTGLC